MNVQRSRWLSDVAKIDYGEDCWYSKDDCGAWCIHVVDGVAYTHCTIGSDGAFLGWVRDDEIPGSEAAS